VKKLAYEFIESVKEMFLSGALGALAGVAIVLSLFLGIAIYVYWALAWSKIFRDLKYKRDWLAWIPIAQIAPILQLGGFHWAWIFIILVPLFGWLALFVLIIISTWRIFEKKKHPGWLSLSMIIPRIGGVLYLIAIGFVAWQNKKPKRKK
jgi:hypothetical protein